MLTLCQVMDGEMKRHPGARRDPEPGNDFRFDDNARAYLTGRLCDLPRYSGLAPAPRLFRRGDGAPAHALPQAACAWGSSRPTPHQDVRVVQQKIEEAARQPAPTQQELSAEDHFNRGLARHDNSDDEIADYTEAIRLNRAVCGRLQ